MKIYTLLESRNTLHKGAIIEYNEDYGKYLYKGDKFWLSISGGGIYPEDCMIDKYEVENSPEKFVRDYFFQKNLNEPEIRVYKEIIRMLLDKTKHSLLCYLNDGTQSIGLEANYPEFIFNGATIRYTFEKTENGDEKIVITKKIPV